MSIFHIATIILVILRATNTIDWSWWTVFAPSIFDITLGVLLIITKIILNLKH